MRRLTIFAMMLAPLGCVAGCGSGGSSSTSFVTAEHAWVACNQRQPVGSPEDPTCKTLAVKACQAAKHEHVTGPGTGVACEVAEPCHGSDCYLGPKSKTEESTTPTQKHTPEEEEHRRNNLKAEEKTAHEEEALENTPGAKKACEEEKRTQEKLQYEHPGSPREPQRQAEYEKLCNR